MKLKQLQTHLKSKKIDAAILVHPDPNLVYLTQMEPSHAYFLITPKKAELYLSDLDKAPKIKGVTIKKLKDWKETLKILKQQKIKQLAVNEHAFVVEQLRKLKQAIPKAKFTGISDKLTELRQEKTPEELSKISKACQITTFAFNQLVKELSKKHQLKTEQDVALFLEQQIRKQGAELAFPTIAAMHKNAAIPHHKTNTTKLSKGFLLLDFGAKWQNYCADMTRVIYLGKPTKQELDFYELLLKAQEKSIQSIKLGISYKQLTEVAKKELGKYAKDFIHSLGHGIGVEVHEAPVFSEKNTKVQKNVPFTIEPGIYFANKFGLRIEDTVVWNGKKTEILTKASKKLQIIK